MKKIAVLILATQLVSVACKKKSTSTADDTSGTSTTGTPTATAIIAYTEGGNTVSVDSANALLYTTSEVGGPRFREIDVYAFKAGKQVLEFHFRPKTGAQTVKSTDFSGAWLTYMTNNGLSYPGDYYQGTSGNFNLSTCDTVNGKLAGTFDFVGSNGSSTKSISAGSMNLSKLKK